MGISTSSLITELREHLGNLSVSELSDADALLHLNRSWWEILNKFPFREKELTATFSTVVGTRNYALPVPFDALRQLSIQDPDSGELTVLKRDTIFSHEEERDVDSDSQGKPERYVREDSMFRLKPTPDQEYTIIIKYWTVLDDLDTDENPAIPQEWHEIILFGAVWRGFLRLRDFSASNQYKIQQVALINSTVPVEAKEEFDSHTTHVEVLGRDYP